MSASNDVIRANKRYLGQICAICKREISLGDYLHICPNCQSINHEECWQNEGGCNSLSCNSLSSSRQSNYNNNYHQSSSSNNFGNYNNGYPSNSLGNSNNSSLGNFDTNSFQRQPTQNSFYQPSSATSMNMNSPMGNSFDGGMSQNMVQCRFCKEPIMRGAKKCKHCGEYQREEDRKIFSQYANDDSFSITDILAIACCPSLIGVVVGTIYCARNEVARGVRVLKYSIAWNIISTGLWIMLNIMIAMARYR